jgi:hypothetical protein
MSTTQSTVLIAECNSYSFVLIAECNSYSFADTSLAVVAFKGTGTATEHHGHTA